MNGSGTSRIPTRPRVLVAVALVSLLFLVASTTPVGARGTATAPPGPNIVLILTDDQRFDELANMPIVDSELVGKGVTFTNGFVVNPLCCPSRTTILTGKYSHGTGIYKNGGSHGGFETFKPEDGSTIATWLHDAGYRTALVGKYLNGYNPFQVSYVPPGWDTWDALALRSGRRDGGYYDYTMSVNGAPVTYGSAVTDYSTDVLSNYATSFIDSVPSTTPLFLYFAPRAPHLPTTPPLRYKQACSGLQPLRPPSYNEADVSDKPAYVRRVPLLDATQQAAIDKNHLKHCQSLLAVDDAVGSILSALQQTGRLQNTLILFSSDNGFLMGEHRLKGKEAPYEESIRVPIVIRYDPVTQGVASTNPDFVLNLDFAPTFADAGGVSAPGAEGVSLLPLLGNPGTPWRSDFLVETGGSSSVTKYCALRSEGYLYVAYETGEQELYDLAADPYELQNVAGNPVYDAVRRQLRARLGQLCNPPPPHYTIDLVAPTTTITSGPPATTADTTATFGFSASEASVTFSCVLDGGAAQPCASGFTYTGLTTGPHTFSVQGTDPSGNVGNAATWSWTVSGP